MAPHGSEVPRRDPVEVVVGGELLPPSHGVLELLHDICRSLNRRHEQSHGRPAARGIPETTRCGEERFVEGPLVLGPPGLACLLLAVFEVECELDEMLEGFST